MQIFFPPNLIRNAIQKIDPRRVNRVWGKLGENVLPSSFLPSPQLGTSFELFKKKKLFCSNVYRNIYTSVCIYIFIVVYDTALFIFTVHTLYYTYTLRMCSRNKSTSIITSCWNDNKRKIVRQRDLSFLKNHLRGVVQSDRTCMSKDAKTVQFFSLRVIFNCRNATALILLRISGVLREAEIGANKQKLCSSVISFGMRFMEKCFLQKLCVTTSSTKWLLYKNHESLLV